MKRYYIFPLFLTPGSCLLPCVERPLERVTTGNPSHDVVTLDGTLEFWLEPFGGGEGRGWMVGWPLLPVTKQKVALTTSS